MIPEFKDDPEILADLVLESNEHLVQIEEHILLLEKDPLLFQLVHSIFRGFHSIKGLAGFLELAGIQSVAHEVETLLDLARNHKLSITPAFIDLVLDASEYLKEEIRVVQTRLDGTFVDEDHSNLSLLARLASANLAVESGASTTDVDPSPLPVQRLTAMTRKAEDEASPIEAPSFTTSNSSEQPSSSDLLSANGFHRMAVLSTAPESLIPPPSSAALPTPPARAQSSPANTTIRVETAKLDRLIDMVGEMVIAQSMLGATPTQRAGDQTHTAGEMSQLTRITGEVQRCALSMRMMPIGPLFQKNAKMVRDLARRSGKQIALELAGEATELDKTIAEELADPLLHMIRNALDHGIELPHERIASGKAPLALLRISAEHQAGQVLISIADDGRGLNAENIRAKAIERGLIDASATLSQDEIFHLIFAPGFSTAEKITDISGRGVGMDVVRKHVETLRGRIEIASELGRGTTFSIYLPLTLAIIDGLVVEVNHHRFVIPLLAIREMFRPAAEQIFKVQGRGEMILIRGRLLPVVRLHERFDIVPRSTSIPDGLLVICEVSGKHFCLFVDGLLGRQEIVIKGLDEALQGIKAVSGSAILSDGRIGLILDVAGVFECTQSFQETSAA